jgi:ABC-type amino acid transport substrate-binding protein
VRERFVRQGDVRRKSILALGLLLGLLTSLPTAGHYLRLGEELVESDHFTVGIALTGRPFAYREEGRVRGFEIAVARAVADAHGLDLKIVQLPRARLLEALLRGEVDAVNTMALPPGSDGATIIPYLQVGDHVMVLKGNPFRVHAVKDLSGRTVATTSGSTAESYAANINEQLITAGREPMNVHSFPYQRDTHFPVSMGHAAAYFIQTVSAVGITQDAESRTRLIEGMFQPSREVGFAVATRNDDIFHAVEHAIAAMVATGKYERIRKQYDLPAELSPFR